MFSEMNKSLKIFLIGISVFCFNYSQAEDGYKLWLRYNRVEDITLLKAYQQSIINYQLDDTSPTHKAIEAELGVALPQLLDKKISATNNLNDGTLLIALISSPLLSSFDKKDAVSSLNAEGFGIFTATIDKKKVIVITANKPVG